MELTVIVAFIACVFIIAVMAKKHRAKKRKQAHQEIIAELGERNWNDPKDALQKLQDLKGHVNEDERRQLARHYLTVWCADLMSSSSRSLPEALAARENFLTEIKEVKRICRLFKLKHVDISPFSEEQMLTAYLNCRVDILEQALERYPDKAWINTSPGDILASLIDYSDPAYVRQNIERWRSWIRSAYLRQAQREVSRLRKRKHWSSDEASTAVDKVLTLLENAKANPEEIETTSAELEQLRQHAQYGT